MPPADPLRPPSDPAREGTLAWLVWGTLVALGAALVGGHALRPDASALYRDVALALPLLLVGVSRAAPHRWACTIMAALYAGFELALTGLLAASPRLAPLAYKLGHVLPPSFPLLLLAPAAALDLLRRLSPRWRLVREALAIGALALAALAMVRAPRGGPAFGALHIGAVLAHVAR